MTDTRTEDVQLSTFRAAPDRRERLYAAGGIIGALLASSCCVFPLLFVMIGVSGAWIGNLTALEPYKPIFAAVALLNIGFGFWRVYFRAKPDCADASTCASKPSRTITQVVLWLGLVLVLVALTTDWWAPLFYQG
jgi:mercuric ion transport protein